MKTHFDLLLVEDDPNLSMIIQDYLEMQGYKTTLAKDGHEGFEAFKKKKYDLLLLDVMMPRKDGFTLAADIRKTDQQTPIIFLTAKAMKEDRIAGFKAGCDDYITKPFSSEELSLRIKAVLKRCSIPISSKIEPLDVFFMGDFTFDVNNMTLSSETFQKVLTRREAELLGFLCENKGQLLKREQILNAVWGNDDYFNGRSMDVFIAKLRKYLKSDPRIQITNVHGTGFRLEVIGE